MSKDNNLTDFLTDVAAAIREKKGTEELINPQNFSEEIKSIETKAKLEERYVKYTSNGKRTVKPTNDKDGISEITIDVAVPTSGDADYNIQSKGVEITENNSVTNIYPDSDYDYMDKVIVSTAIPMQEKSVTYNDNVSGAVIEADSGYGGLSKVTINVDVPNQGSDVSIEPVKTVGITENNHTRVISPAVGYDALAGVNVNVNIPLQDKTVEIRGTGETLISADATYEGLNSVKVTPILEAKTTTITANNTYSISASEGNCGIGEHTIIVSVPTSGGGESVVVKEAEPKDVNFYDYDGTLLHSYTKAEAQALTALPAVPSAPEGLGLEDTVEWNYTLDQIKDMGVCEVGSIYTKNSGMALVFDIPYDNFTLGLQLRCSSGGADVDWGDKQGGSFGGQEVIGHTYTKAGRYVIRYDAKTEATIAVGTSNYNVCNDMVTSTTNGFAHSSLLVGAVLGNNCTFSQSAFYCCGLTYCIISKGVKIATIPQNAFSYCYQLKHITFPCAMQLQNGALSNSGVRHLSLTMDGGDVIANSEIGGVLNNCANLRRLVLPPAKDANTLPLSNLSSTSSLCQLIVKKGRVFTGRITLRSLAVLDLTDYDDVPTLDSTLSLPTKCKIFVKSGLLSSFKTATNWSKHSSKFAGV